ncbi:hypothetical protein FMN50_12585 [Rhodobacterales bacterium]|nr:hypothetical protein FMN50_12585 [Rhodobacterales bacterium]
MGQFEISIQAIELTGKFSQTALCARPSRAASFAGQAKHACPSPSAIGIGGTYLYSAANFERPYRRTL